MDCSGPRARGAIERRVLREDRILQAPQLGARLDTDLVDQDRARLPVGLERLRLSSAAIQREHASRVQLLAQGVRFDERLELADRLGVPPRLEVRVECELGRVQTQFVEPADLGCGERLVREVGERLPAPQRKRLPCARFAEQALELRRVDVAIGQLQLVAAPMGDDLCAVAVEQPAQVRHVELDHLRRAGRRMLTPEPFGETVGGDRVPDTQRQHRQHRALLRTAERERSAIEDRLDGP